MVDGGVEVALDEVAVGLADCEDPVLAILGVMVEYGFVGDIADVEAAVRWIARRERGSGRRRPPRRLRSAVCVIENLREAMG